MSPETRPEIKLEELLESRDRFGRAVAVAIVVTTFVGALTAFLQAKSLEAHDNAIARADEWATLGAHAGARWDRAAQVQIDRFRLEQRARVRAKQADARYRLHVGPDQMAARLEAKRWYALSAQLHRASLSIADDTRLQFDAIHEKTRPSFPDIPKRAIEGEGKCRAPPWASQRAPAAIVSRPDIGPERDPLFPARYLAESRREVYLFTALRDGANAEAEAGEKQFTRYAVSLTMCAVAVFLFGFSLSPYGRPHRRLFTVVAGSLAVGAFGWGIYSTIRAPEKPSDAAAVAFADGRVAMERDSVDGPRQAIYYFGCAIDLRPEFAQAYIERAIAYNALGADPFVTNVAQTPSWARKRARQDLERASELGAEDPGLSTELGADVYVTAMEESDQAGLRKALQLHEAGLQRLEEHPIPPLDVAQTRLVLGMDWRDALEEAEKKAKASGWGADYFVAQALTAFDYIAERSHDPAVKRETTVAKQHAVEAFFPSPRNRSSPAPKLIVDTLAIRPGFVQFFIEPSSRFDPARDHVVAQWYYRPSPQKPWSVVAGLSGPTGATLRSDSHGRYFQVKPYQGPLRDCLRTGRYRVEVYVDGKLAGGSETAAEVAGVVPAQLADMAVDVCPPEGWKAPAGTLPGIADGFVDRGRRRGMLVFDVSAAASEARRRRGMGRVLDRTIRQFDQLLPKQLKRQRAVRLPFLGGSPGGVVRLYRYRGGTMVAGIGVTGAERVLVGIVFGPRAMFIPRSSRPPSDAENLFFSIRALEGLAAG